MLILVPVVQRLQRLLAGELRLRGGRGLLRRAAVVELYGRLGVPLACLRQQAAIPASLQGTL